MSRSTRLLLSIAVAVLAVSATSGCGRAAEPPELTALPSPSTPVLDTSTPDPTAALPSPSAVLTGVPGPVGRAPSPGTRTTMLPAGRSFTAYITFYGAADNDPPGSVAIAHPIGNHTEAGGTGTYADPISLASDVREIAVGTLVYYPPLQKYFVMVDDCASCIEEWNDSRRPHLDLWTGDFSGPEFLACENGLTPGGPVTVELGPPAGRPVDARPLFGSSGCLR